MWYIYLNKHLYQQQINVMKNSPVIYQISLHFVYQPDYKCLTII